jgi:uncharacterized phage-like protein YoqJ
MDNKMIYAGTGHRPQFLPCKFNENDKWLERTLVDLEKWLRRNESNIEYIISGGAIGWDTWLAECARFFNIPYKIYAPFKGQENKWPTVAKERYDEMLTYAREVIYVREAFSKQAFLYRDQKMVDDANEVLALWNPSHKSGGTYHTISYAESQGKKIYNFWKGQ